MLGQARNQTMNTVRLAVSSAGAYMNVCLYYIYNAVLCM